MAGFRVTERAIAGRVLVGLQRNLDRLGVTQQQLSSGKMISKASDSPGGTVSAMQFRADIANQQQYSRNVDDGLGWLGAADTALDQVIDHVNRVRSLVVANGSAGTGQSYDARDAMAAEVEGLRNSMIGVANTNYLDRPIFGGTVNGNVAYNPLTGAYVGDTGQVSRSIGDNTKVRVAINGPAAFGSGNQQLFSMLSNIASGLRNGTLNTATTLTALDDAASRLQTAMSSLGARYNQLDRARQTADDRAMSLQIQLSNVEDVDLPKTITDLQLQQTAYQAALAAASRVVQPSLVDFVR